jgi:ketosteroid isomerase-like protein
MTPDSKSEVFQVLAPYAAALTANDPEKMIAAYHDDAVIHYFGSNPFAGTVKGKTALLEVFKRIRQKVNRRIMSVVDLLIGQEYGVVIVLERWERDGSAVELERVFRYKVGDGKILEVWAYDRDQALVDRLLS